MNIHAKAQAVNRTTPARRQVLLALLTAPTLPALAATLSNQEKTTMTSDHTLSPRQLAIAPIAATMAVGDLPQLNAALNQGLDAGLTVGDAREILVQLYAYAGFPRSLNALGELMKVIEARRQRGVQDAPGREPETPVPAGKDLLALGTANQTKLSGAPVQGPLFEFAPAIDTFLKTHLFGDIFARDNLDWPSRELATVGALASLAGVEPQLQSHVRISMNVGLTAAQLRSAAGLLAERGQADAARRVRAAVDKEVAQASAR
jgi:4-carboxymuconolactone decarboxylase